jgi:hypothetical protein
MKKIILKENVVSKLKFKLFNEKNIKPIETDLLEYNKLINGLFNKLKNVTINDIYSNDTLFDGKSIDDIFNVVNDKKDKINNLIKLSKLEYNDFVTENNLEDNEDIISFITSELETFESMSNNLINKVDEIVRLLEVLKTI